MNSEQDYIKLLDLLYRVVEANRGPLNGADDRYWYAEGLVTKFFMHAASILYLSRQTSIPEMLSTPLKFIDSASIDVLTRAAFEAFLTFHYVFIAPATPEEADYRYWAYTAAGLAERQRSPASAPEHKQKLAKEKKELDVLHNKLCSNTTFKNLTNKQKLRVLKGEWRLLSWREIAETAGLVKILSSDMYRHLSGYVHSGSLSIFQIKQALQKEEQPLLIQSSMDFTNIATANVIHEYCELFPRAKNALCAYPKGTDIVGIWVQIGWTLDSETPTDNENRNT